MIGGRTEATAVNDDTGDGIEVVVSFVSERDVVFEYRRRELEAAGFGEAEAVWIAQDPSIDLHDAVALVKKCEPGLAARILL